MTNVLQGGRKAGRKEASNLCFKSKTLLFDLQRFYYKFQRRKRIRVPRLMPSRMLSLVGCSCSSSSTSTFRLGPTSEGNPCRKREMERGITLQNSIALLTSVPYELGFSASLPPISTCGVAVGSSRAPRSVPSSEPRHCGSP